MRRRRELRTRRREVVSGPIALLVAAAVLVSASSVLAAPPPGPPELQTLWREYPLEEKAQPVEPVPVNHPPATRIVRQSPATRIVSTTRQVSDAGGESSIVPAFVIGLAALAFLLLTFVLTRRFRLVPPVVHIRPEGVAMPMFGDRKAGRTKPESEGERLIAAPRLSRYATEETRETPAPPVSATTAEGSEYAQLGEHVGAVLEAAKEAAEKMRLQAGDAARQIRADGEHRARMALEKAQKQARQVEAEAALLEAETKKQSAKIRKEAEAYAGSMRQGADSRAAAALDRAERQAADRVRATQERLHALDANVTGTEQRLRQLVGGLRELASSLDDLASGPTPVEEPSAEAAAGDAERGSLTGALTRSVAEHRSIPQPTKSL